MNNQKPSVGRIVHYASYGTPGGEFGRECRAAVVTEVEFEADAAGPAVLGLAVLNPTGAFFSRGVEQDESDKPGGTWHWPERT